MGRGRGLPVFCVEECVGKTCPRPHSVPPQPLFCGVPPLQSAPDWQAGSEVRSELRRTLRPSFHPLGVTGWGVRASPGSWWLLP